MTENWSFYFCQVNGALASIFVDMGLKNEVPILSKPWLLWAWLYFRSPRPDGLSSDVEAPKLFEIEEALSQRFTVSCDAIFSGRITTSGRREFYFYGSAPVTFEADLADVMARFPDYKFDKGTKKDPDWHQYLNVLYPSPKIQQQMHNRDLIEYLKSNQDSLHKRRDVVHRAYFPSETDARRFAAAASGFGYDLLCVKKDELSYLVELSRLQDVKLETANELAVQLCDIAQQCNGEYDGWETPLTR